MSVSKSAILAEAAISLGSNKLRSFLTMLGIIIGVGAVVLMLAIGQGVQNGIRETISSMGSNVIIVLSGSTTAGGLRLGFGTTPTLTLDDARAIAAMPDVEAVAPAMPGTAQVVAGTYNWSTAVVGIDSKYMEVREWGMRNGRDFTENELRSGGRVALLGQTVWQNLFPDGEDPVGKTIRIKNMPFEVAGVLLGKGQTLDGRDQDDMVFVPLATAQRKLFGSQFPNSVRIIIVKAKTQEIMNRLQEDLRTTLRQQHRLQESADDDFSIRNLTSIAQSAESTGKAMSMLLGAIASISLVVGGIGIMNIMLVSVTERTREIGVRKAIGFYERDILTQFLMESVLISLAGGFIGLMLGIGCSAIASALTGITTQVSLFSVVLSFAVAASVGIFFGFYPARKAAKLRPIEALRYQ